MSRIDRKTTLAALGMTLSVLMAGCGGTQTEETLLSQELIAPSKINYETDIVEKRDYVRTSTDALSIYYPREAELFWDQSNTRLQELCVMKEQEVKKGDVLAVFETDVDLVRLEELGLQVERLQKTMEIEKTRRLNAIAELEEDYAEGKLERDKRFEQGYGDIHTEELNSYTTEIEELTLERMRLEYREYVYQTEWQINSLLMEMEDLREEAQDNKIVAPFDGFVKSVATVEEGERIDPGTLILTMYSKEDMLLAAKDLSGYFRYNMDVSVEAGKDKARETFSGKVVAATNILPWQYTEKMALVKLDEPVEEEVIKRKARYTIEVLRLNDVLLIDRHALEDENEDLFVYVLNGDMVQKRYITMGDSTSDDVWILDGLSEGQLVITN